MTAFYYLRDGELLRLLSPLSSVQFARALWCVQDNLQAIQYVNLTTMLPLSDSMIFIKC